MPVLKDVGVDDGLGGHKVVILQDRDPLDAAGGRQDHAGQPPAVWPAVAARRLWAVRSARCRVTEGPAARCMSTRSRSMRARMCARRLTRPSSMTMPSAAARASGFLLWSFPRRLALLSCRHLDWLGHAAAVTRRSPRRLRRPPEDAPVAPGRPSGRLRRMAKLLTRGSVIVGDRCDQPRPGAPGVRAERLAPGPCASSAGGTRHGPGGAARDPRRVGRASPGPARHEREIAHSSQGPCASSVTPNPGTPMPAYGWWYARTGIIWSSSGRTRPVPVVPSVGPARCVTGWSSLANY